MSNGDSSLRKTGNGYGRQRRFACFGEFQIVLNYVDRRATMHSFVVATMALVWQLSRREYRLIQLLLATIARGATNQIGHRLVQVLLDSVAASGSCEVSKRARAFLLASTAS
jgi:hypothetical protein